MTAEKTIATRDGSTWTRDKAGTVRRYDADGELFATVPAGAAADVIVAQLADELTVSGTLDYPASPTHPESEQVMAEHLAARGYPPAQAGIVAAHYWSSVRAGCATWQGLEGYAAQAYPASHTPVADALQVVDENRAELLFAQGHYAGEGDVSSERDAYLGALENLAAAVRSHGIGAELGRLREQRTHYPAAHCAGCGAWYLAGHGPRCWVGKFEATGLLPDPLQCERCAGPLVAGEGDDQLCGPCTEVAADELEAELGQQR